MRTRRQRAISGQDLAEYGIALGVVGTAAATIAVAIRFELFILWWRGAFKAIIIAAAS